MPIYKHPELDILLQYTDEQVAAGTVPPTMQLVREDGSLGDTEEQTKARQLLLDTDWYVIRLQETGKPIPEAVIAARQLARTVLNGGDV